MSQPTPVTIELSEAQARFLGRIERFLKQHKLSPTGFGREALGDTSFVHRLRVGREARESTREKVLQWMKGYRK